MAKARKITQRGLPSHSVASVPAVVSDGLLGDVRAMIEAAREQTARAVTAVLAGLYWHIGKRIREDILHERRAEYGERIVSALGRQLTMEYGRGFSEKNLRHMLRFAEAFPDEQIVSALRRELSWTHFKEIIYLGDPLKRDFYAEMCRVERWNTRTLRRKIGHMLYEHTALSKKPNELIGGERQALRWRPICGQRLLSIAPCVAGAPVYAAADSRTPVNRHGRDAFAPPSSGDGFASPYG
jgi:hypothetical protein